MKYFTFFFLFSIALVPQFTFAQGGLVQCQGGAECNFCDFTQTVTSVSNWIVLMASLIAVLLLAYAGYLLVTSKGDVGAVGKARDIFSNVVIGIIFIVLSWSMVDILMKSLTGGEIGVWNPPADCGGSTPVAPANEYAIFLEDNRVSEVYAVEGPESVIPAGTGIGIGSANKLSQAQGDALTAVAAISVSSSGGCVDKNNSACTSFDGINNATLQRVLTFQGECGCDIVITGGSEVGHAVGTYSHGNGYKIDIRPSTRIDSYISSSYKPCGTRGGYCDAGGTEFVREGTHWDITVI